MPHVDPHECLVTLVESIRVEYDVHIDAAKQALDRKDGRTARVRYGMAAAVASILALYYQDTGNSEAATTWGERAGRYLRRALAVSNLVLKNIGAEMS